MKRKHFIIVLPILILLASIFGISLRYNLHNKFVKNAYVLNGSDGSTGKGISTKEFPGVKDLRADG